MLSKESWPPSLPGGEGGGGERAGEEGLGRDNCKNPLREDRLLIRPTGGVEEGRGRGMEARGSAPGRRSGAGCSLSATALGCLVLWLLGQRLKAKCCACLSEGDSSAWGLRNPRARNRKAENHVCYCGASG